MKSIGGYFELELRNEDEYHKNAIRLNSGRNAFEYILRTKEYKKAYLPYFTCNAMLEPLNKLNLNYELYSINNQFEPLFDFNRIAKDEAFVYTNYFGIKGSAVARLSNICPNLIIDNSQAFFDKPITEVDTFYSPRKFFGIADGAYLYTNTILSQKVVKDVSFDRMSHLLKRIDLGAELSYCDFKRNDEYLKGQEIKEMSKLSMKILQNIDYKGSKTKRIENFQYIHKYLCRHNMLHIDLDSGFVPMVYPFFTNRNDIRQLLIKNKIYVATYWPNVLEWCRIDSLEYSLTNKIIPIPIDQRYSIKDMDRIIKLII